jgi:hypothetical protein
MKQAAVLMLFFSLVLSACISINASPESELLDSTRGIVPISEPTGSSLILAPTATKTLSRPSIPTTGRNPILSVTSTPERGMDFTKANVIGMAHLDNGYFLVTINLPGKAEGEFRATVAADDFECMVLNQYPERLYCTGITTHAGQYVLFTLYHSGDELPVFETVIGIPPVYITRMLRYTRKVNKSEAEPTGKPPDQQPTPTAVPYPYPGP